MTGPASTQACEEVIFGVFCGGNKRNVTSGDTEIWGLQIS